MKSKGYKYERIPVGMKVFWWAEMGSSGHKRVLVSINANLRGMRRFSWPLYYTREGTVRRWKHVLVSSTVHITGYILLVCFTTLTSTHTSMIIYFSNILLFQSELMLVSTHILHISLL